MNKLVPKDESLIIPQKDKDNPRSVINLVPLSVSKSIECIPDEVFALGEAELKKMAKPTEAEEKLRYSFWREYDLAQIGHRRMMISNVVSGVCHNSYFFRYVVTNSFKMAYILTPPPDYEVTIQEMLALGLSQLRDILTQPHVKKNGEVDSKLADVKYRIVEGLQLRVKGAVPHRVESKNLNVNVEQQSPAIPQVHEMEISVEAIEQELQRLRSSTPTSGVVIEVTPDKQTQETEG